MYLAAKTKLYNANTRSQSSQQYRIHIKIKKYYQHQPRRVESTNKDFKLCGVE